VTGNMVVETTVRGMTVVAAQLSWAPTCVGSLHVPAGFAHDPPGQAGTAHLTEHICAAVAARRGRMRIAARTDATATRYSARAGRGGAAALVRTLTSAFTTEAADPRLLEAEIQAVLTENARLRDQPQLHVAHAVASRAVPISDLAVRDATTQATLAAVAPADVGSFVHRWYRPEGAVLCVVAPDDPDAVIHEVDAALAAVPPGVRQPALDPTPAQPYQVSGWSDCVVWATLTPPATTDDDLLARQLAVELLTGASGLLDEAGAAVGTRSTGRATLIGSRAELLVVAWPPGPHTRHLLSALHRPIPELAGGTEAAAIAAARARLRSRIAFDQQSPGGLAALLVRYMLGRGPWPALDVIGDSSDGVRVVDFAARLLAAATYWQIQDGTLGEWQDGS
jgi:predicted Zn-dependent peptidase